MKIAIEGCCHGELDAIYKHIEHLETKNGYKVDLLLICGDFQAIRNHQDLKCMAVPDKYKKLGEFYRYYTGQAKAPILTIVIGGNHEASNYLWELYHGGWLAPNIYFLGHAGCVQVNGIRIAGASGIFKGHDFPLGHWEKHPYDKNTMRSIYHIREYNICRLSLLRSPDIFMSHDWPQAIEQHGDVQGLLRRKPFFREDIKTGRLGSPPLAGLLHNLKPKWWFSAHLHVRFEATVIHDQDRIDTVPPMQTGTSEEAKVPTRVENPDEIVIDDEDYVTSLEPILPKPSPMQAGNFVEAKVPARVENPDEIVIDDEDYVTSHEPTLPKPSPMQAGNFVEAKAPARVENPDEIVINDEDYVTSHETTLPKPSRRRETKFLALDKCLPKRQFLEVIDVPIDPLYCPSPPSQKLLEPKFTYDPEWLAITRAFHPYLSTTRFQRPLPAESQARDMVKKEFQWVLENVGDKDKNDGLQDIADSQIFWQTAPGPGGEGDAKFQQPPWYTNPQTVSFCTMLELENKINPVPPGMGTVAVPVKSDQPTEAGK